MAFETVGATEGTQYAFEAPGQELIGALVEHSDRIEGEFGEYSLWTFEVDGENVKVLAGGILQDKLEKADGKRGDVYRIVFEGLKTSKKNKNRKYKDWTVQIDRKSPKTDWDDREAF